MFARDKGNERDSRTRLRHSLLRRIGTFELLAVLVAAVCSLLLSRAYAKNEAFETSSRMSDAAAAAVDAYFTDENIESTLSSDKTEQYQSMLGSIQEICDGFDLAYLYVYTVDSSGHRTYKFCLSSRDHLREKSHPVLKFGDVTTEPLSEQERAALAGQKPKTCEEIRNRYGYTFAWYFPLHYDDGSIHGVIGAEYDAGTLLEGIVDNTFAFALPMIAILTVVVFLGLWLMKLHVIDPLRYVSERMVRFTQGLGGESIEVVNREDEIAEIVRSYNAMSEDIKRYVKELEQMTADRVAHDTELEVARKIQVGFVPETSDLAGIGFNACACERSARSVGGDFYDLFELSDGRVCVVVADVSGKGISAALFMAMCRTLLRDKLTTSETVASALNEANDIICGQNPEGFFVTVFAGIFDPVSGILRYANAGHARPYLTASGIHHPDSGIALGLFEDAGILDAVVTLAPGQGIVLYTDGVTEAIGPGRKFFGEARIAGAVEGATCAREAMERLMSAVDTFVGAGEQFDDITVLTLFAEDGVRDWSETLAPEVSSFCRIRDAIVSLVGTDAAAKRAILACDEAFANVCSYSGATTVDVSCRFEDGTLTVCFSDDGIPFDPVTAELVDTVFENLDQGGMGLSFIAELASSQTYERVGSRNVFTLSFDFVEGSKD